MKLQPEKLIYGGLFLILVAMAGIILVCFRQSLLLQNSTRQMDLSNNKLHSLEELLFHLFENAAAARGYALTGFEKYLDELNQSEMTMHSGFISLKKQFEEDTANRLSIDSLQSFIAGRTEASKNIVLTRQQKGIQAAAMVAAGKGEIFLANSRYVILRLEVNERERLQQLNENKQSGFLLINKLLLGSLLLILLLISFLLILIRRELDRRKKAQAELSRFNENLREEIKQKIKEQAVVFERITDAFVALDKDWCYTYMNKKAGEIFNRNPEKMIGKHIWTEFPEGIGQPFHKAYEKVMATQQYVYLEEYYAPYDRWFENHIYPSPEGLSVFFRDITEKKKTELALELSNRYLEEAEVLANTGYFYYNFTTGEATWSKGLFRIYGIRPEEFEGTYEGFIKRVHPDDRDSMNKVRENLIDPGHPLFFEIRIVRPDGSIRHLNSIIKLVKDATGGPEAFMGTATDITEQKKAEQKIRKNEELYKDLVDNITDLICTHDLDGRILSMNKAAEKAIGQNFDPRKNLNIKDILTTGTKSKYDDYIADMLKNGYARGVMKVKNSDGEIRTWEFNNSLKLSGANFPPIIRGHARDITEQKKAEEALKESNLSLSEAQRIAKIGHWTYYMNGDLRWSDNMYQLYGLPSKITATTPDFFFKLVHPDDREKMQQWMQACLAGEVPGKYEFRSIFPDGSIHYYSGSGEMIYDMNNNPVYMQGIVQDITDRKIAEQALIESEEKYRTLVQQAADAIFIVDQEGNYLDANESASLITGYSIDELKKMNGRDIIETVDLNKNPVKLEEIKRGQTVYVERVIKRKDNALLNVDIKAKLMDNGKVIVILRDITQRKKDEEEIKNTAEQLRQLTAYLQNIREEERKRIGREIHDELGQQLTAIKMDVAWMDKKIPDETTEVKSKLKNILTLLDGSNQSVRKILNELRPDGLENQELAEALEWQSHQFAESTGIGVEFTSSGKFVKLPEQIATCMFRVYQESLTNIMRYAQAGKVLTSLKLTDDSIVLTIKDDGKGFDIKSVKSKKSFGILGMKERVHSLNGKFELVSAKGKGTKIVVSLPYSHN